MSLLASKLNIEIKTKLVRCYVWSIDLYGSQTWTLIGAEVFLELWNVVLEENGEDEWSEEVTNEQVLDSIGE